MFLLLARFHARPVSYKALILAFTTWIFELKGWNTHQRGEVSTSGWRPWLKTSVLIKLPKIWLGVRGHSFYYSMSISWLLFINKHAKFSLVLLIHKNLHFYMNIRNFLLVVFEKLRWKHSLVRCLIICTLLIPHAAKRISRVPCFGHDQGYRSSLPLIDSRIPWWNRTCSSYISSLCPLHYLVHLVESSLTDLKRKSSSFVLFCLLAARGRYFRNFWVRMCRWDPGTLNLYQS